MARKHVDNLVRLALGAAVWLSLSLWCAGASATPQMSMAAFRDAFVAAVKRAHPDERVKVVSDDEVVVTNAHDAQVSVYLDHAYSYYQADPPS